MKYNLQRMAAHFYSGDMFFLSTRQVWSFSSELWTFEFPTMIRLIGLPPFLKNPTDCANFDNIVSIRPKLYAYALGVKEFKKSKGVRKYVIQ